MDNFPVDAERGAELFHFLNQRNLVLTQSPNDVGPFFPRRRSLYGGSVELQWLHEDFPLQEFKLIVTCDSMLFRPLCGDWFGRSSPHSRVGFFYGPGLSEAAPDAVSPTPAAVAICVRRRSTAPDDTLERPKHEDIDRGAYC